MISVSDLAPALAILGITIFYYLQRVSWKKSIIYVGYTYNKNIKIITLIIVLPHICEAMKQDSIYSKLPFLIL